VSTLAGEIGLVRAYLDVLRNSCSARITLEADLSPAAAAAAFPAMVLPCAIRHEVEGIVGQAALEATWRIEADLVQSRLRVRVSGATRNLSGRDDDRIEFLRARLASLYGERARFVRRCQVQGARCEVETIIEVPQ
jgi:LytS/YehU family sensor histidine kinase